MSCPGLPIGILCTTEVAEMRSKHCLELLELDAVFFLFCDSNFTVILMQIYFPWNSAEKKMI